MHCCEAATRSPITRSKRQKTPGFFLQCWHIRYNKQPSDSEGEVWDGSEWSEENRDCQSIWAGSGNSERERASRRSLPSPLWLMSQQKDAPLYNGCWQSSCLTGLCFDSAHCFQKNSGFFFHLFLWWGRSVSVSFTLSSLPPGFLWFLWQRVFGLQLLDTSIALSERPVYCTSETRRNRQVRLDRSIKYI